VGGKEGIGDAVKTAAMIVAGLTMAGHPVGHAPNEAMAAEWLSENVFDLVIVVGCDRLEQTDLDAEHFKSVHPDQLRVFVLWDGVEEFEQGSDYGLAAIDMLLAGFSVKQCMRAYGAVAPAASG
jgi:hypothetical protein